MPGHQTLLSFNAGELSPYLWHRTDFAKHASGLAACENFMPLPYGGLRKRPGTTYLADLGSDRRLEPFAFNTSTRYILAFSTTDLKIYAPDGTLKSTETYAFGDPYLIQTAHVNDVLFLTSPNFPPQQLSRVADTNWTIEDIPFTHPPLLDENEDDASSSFPKASRACFFESPWGMWAAAAACRFSVTRRAVRT